MDSIANVTCEVNLINISFLVIQFVLDVLVLANIHVVNLINISFW